jgi:hypothetical protein
MAAISGFNTTSNNDLVPTESINPYVIPAANFIRVYEAITWAAPARGTAHKWPRYDAVAVTGTHTEADSLSATSYPTSVESVNGAVVGTYAFASDQLAAASGMAPIETQIANMTEELRNRINRDILATFGGASNLTDNSGSNLSLDNWETALAAFYAQKPLGPRFAFVGSTNQIRDLRKAIRSSGNGGLIMGAGLEVFNGLPNRGYVGTWQGVEIYQGDTTEYDASNDAGGFVSCAEMGVWTGPEDYSQGGQYQVGCGLGLALWPLRGTYGISARAQELVENVGTKLVASAMYGAAITADHLVRGFVSKKAA